MSKQPDSPTSTLVEGVFHSMEEVNEITRLTGWENDFRQMGKGAVTSRWRSIHLGDSALISHQLDNHVDVRVVPPKGCVAMAFVPPSYHHLLVDGAEFGTGQVIVADAETHFVVPALSRCDTLVVSRPEFEKSAHALFPEMSTNGRLVNLIDGPLSKWSVLQVGYQKLLRRGDISPEDLSQLLCRFLDLMAGETERRSGETFLGTGSVVRIARLAQEYIEAHYTQAIRIEDLCRYTGVSVRTLQRSFRKYFLVTPYEYITARRLNAARQALAASDSSDYITSLAFDNGFNHLGRFSVMYREHFGESPKETLARRTPKFSL